jgi:hypothetical protein
MTVDTQVTPAQTRSSQGLGVGDCLGIWAWMGTREVAIAQIYFLRTELPKRNTNSEQIQPDITLKWTAARPISSYIDTN